VRRNKVGVIAGGIALLSLIVGLGLASYGLVRAKEEAEVARTQAERASAVVRLIDEMFGSADPFLDGAADYTVRQLLTDYSDEFQGRVDGQPEVELSLQRTIASAYMGVADYASAERHFRRAVDLSVALDHPDQDVLRHDVGWALRQQGRYQAALEESHGSDILQIEVHRLLGNHAESLKLAKNAKSETQRGLTILALAYAEAQDFEMAGDLAKRALDLVRKKYGSTSPRLIRPLDTLATIAEKEGLVDQSKEYSVLAQKIAQSALPVDHPARLFAEARAARTSQPEKQKSLTSRLLEKVGEKPEVFTPLLKLTATLASEGKEEDARSFLTKKLGINYADFSSGESVSMKMSGDMVRKIMLEGRVKNYIPLIEQALSISGKLLGEEHIHTIELKRLLAYMYRWDKRYSESERLSREAIASCRGLLGETHGTTSDCILHLAKTLWDQNKDEEADLLLMGDFENTRSDVDTARVLERQGKFFLENGRLFRAERLLDEALAICRRVYGVEHVQSLRVLFLLGELEVEHRWIRQVARGPLLIEAYDLSRKVYGDDSLETANCVRRLCADAGQLLGVEETEALCKQALIRAQEAGASEEVIAVLDGVVQRWGDFRTGYQKSTAQHLQRINELKAEGNEVSAESVRQLSGAVFGEIRLGDFANGEKHLALVQKIIEQLPKLDAEVMARYENVEAWAKWRAGHRKQAGEISFLCEAFFGF